MADETLWIRLGDGDGYQNLGTDLSAVIATLREAEVKDIKECYGGVEAPGFKGHNYISLYWGKPDSADMVRCLSENEFRRVARELSE